MVWDSKSNKLRTARDLCWEVASHPHDQRQGTRPGLTRKRRCNFVNLPNPLRFGVRAYENWERAFQPFFALDKSMNRVCVAWVAAQPVNSVGSVGCEFFFMIQVRSFSHIV